MKKSIFVSFIFTFIFVLCSVSYGGNNTYDLPLPDVDDVFYYVILKNNDGSFTLHKFFNLRDTCEENDYEGCHHVIAGYGPKYVFHSGDSSWTFQGNNLQCILSCSVPTHWNGEFYNRQILYSNFDIKDSSGNLIFSNSPLVVTPDEVPDDSSILSGIGDFFNSLFDKLSSWFSSVIDYIKAIPSNIAYLFNNLGSLLSNLLNDIFNYIKSIPQSIVDLFKTLFQFLFVPSDNLFSDFQTMLEDKFAIFFQLAQITFDSTTIDLTDSAPNFHITINGKDYKFIDLSFYSQYRSFVHTIIILITAFQLSRWLLINCPNIIKGESVDPKTGEVITTISNGRR